MILRSAAAGALRPVLRFLIRRTHRLYGLFRMILTLRLLLFLLVLAAVLILRARLLPFLLWLILPCRVRLTLFGAFSFLTRAALVLLTRLLAVSAPDYRSSVTVG
ncbi:MAG: hypothetical protein ACLR5G_16510 [Eubacteriales bacterium]